MEAIVGRVRSAEAGALGEHLGRLRVAVPLVEERHPAQVQPGPQVGPRARPPGAIQLREGLVVAPRVVEALGAAHPLLERELDRRAAQRLERRRGQRGLGVLGALHDELGERGDGLVPRAAPRERLGERVAHREQIDLARASPHHRAQELHRARRVA
ncbi:MAG: hypothetical protein M5U28_51950 [Sandaracinaceae bacterium]|nr:hypothetical protein [Sandaracinaceae bacterium]